MEVGIAAAEAVALCNIDVAAVYPITPQSHIAEHMADIIHDGRIDSEFITVESEHSAISALAGASAAGARAYTATSSQGLMLMHEILPIVSAMRLPICMANANRAVSGPLNIWNDHTDIMPQRDSGWICLFTENGQEVIDLSIMSFKIAEDPEVMLPCVVNIDGFQLTHMIEPMEFPSKAEVAKFLPPRKPFASLHPDNPISMGCFAMPDTYSEVTKAKETALINSKKVVAKVFNDWAKRFGRKYSVVETYKNKGADTLILTMGSMGETAATAIDEMRKKGAKVGLVKLRLWRPFPVEELRAALQGCKTLIVMDRAISYGGAGGPVATDIRSFLYADRNRPKIVDFIMGLGGRDVTVDDFIAVTEKAKKMKDATYEFHGVRE
jgi:pyruvate ferredoxin oxidoreductase alpha subunit